MASLDIGAWIGKFYRFKPRSQWPPSLQQSIPEDKPYFMHPAIIVGRTSTGVDVVTTTSSPNMGNNTANYTSISHQTPSIVDTSHPEFPIIVNAALPKPSWAVLDSRRRFDVSILQPWVENGVQFKLGKGSRVRLAQKVDARMKVVAQQGGSANTLVRTVGVTSPKSESSLDIQDIKKSLAGLKVAVSALEGLCEKLESRAEAEAAPTPSATHQIVQLQITDSRGQAPEVEGLQAQDAETTASASMSSVNLAGTQGAGLKPPSKRSRLKKWSSNIFKGH